MAEVKVINGEKSNLHQKLTKFLTISLGLLLIVIVLFSHSNPDITGYSVFSGTYGYASPLVIVLLLVAVIFLYLKLRQE